MTNPLHLFEAPRRPDLPEILWRIAWPFFLFAAVLAGLLTLSFLLLLPRYTRIDVGGVLRDARGIVQYKNDLIAEIAAKEQERQNLVLAVHDPQYDALKTERRARLPLDELRTQLTDAATKSMGKEDAVQWSSFDYDPSGASLTVSGDVRNVGTRSMTALAQFVAALKTLPFVGSVSTPAFTRDEDATGIHSPFTITITLR